MFKLLVAVSVLTLGAAGVSAACPKDQASAIQQVSGRAVAATDSGDYVDYSTNGLKIWGVQPTKLRGVKLYSDLDLLVFELPGKNADYTKAFAASYPTAKPLSFFEYGDKGKGSLSSARVLTVSGQVELKCQYR